MIAGQSATKLFLVLASLTFVQHCSEKMPVDVVKQGEYLLKEYPDGRKFYWHSNKQIAIKEYYVDGQKEGTFTLYHANGVLKSKQNYHKGLLTGSFKVWSDKGILTADMNYKNNKFVGKASWYYDDGTRKTEQLFNQSGKKDGVETWWYDNKISDQKNLKQSEYHYSNGVLNGRQQAWYSDGSIAYDEVIAQGTGKFFFLHSNGKVWYLGLMKKNKRHGKWHFYSKTGDLYKTVWYKDGKQIKKIGSGKGHS